MKWFSSVVIGATVCCAADSIPEAIAGLSAQATQAYRHGQIGAARALYEKALESHPRYGPALAGLGRIELAEHQRRQAVRHLAQAYQEDPDNPEVVRDFAQAVGDPKLTATLLDRLIHLSKTSPEERYRAQAQLQLYRRLGDRITNQLISPYRAYALPMPVAQSVDGRTHGWTLRIRINGHRPLRLLLDTGSRSLLIAKSRAGALGLEPLAESRIGGFGGGTGELAQATLAERVSVDGQLELANVVVEVANHRFVEGVDGLIGTDLFRHFLVVCNGRKKQLELEPFAGQDGSEGAGQKPWANLDAPPPGEEFRPYRSLGHLIVLEDRTAQGSQWVLDTGAAYSIVHEELPSLNSETVTLVGVSGTAQVIRKEHPLHYDLGSGRKWTREVVATDLTPISAQYGVQLAGFLGFPAFRHREVTIDARNGSIRIRR